MKVMIIGDLHIPFEHPRALDFCIGLEEKYNPDKVVQLGDFVDFYAFSMHGKDPDMIGAKEELTLTQERVKAWENAFPDMRIVVGNHESRLYRKLAHSDITSMIVRSLEDIIGLQSIKYEETVTLDDVVFMHGTGTGGQYHAKNLAERIGKSVVAGHTHSNMICHYMNFNGNVRVGVNAGCLVNNDHLAFAYGSAFLRKPMIGACIIDTETLNVQFERLLD